MRLREVVESRPVVGSSKNIMEGLMSSYSPIDVLFFSPPEMPLILVSPIQVFLHFSSPRFLMISLTLPYFSSYERSGNLRSVTNLNDS